jgi:YVTN family beta-propeller protein
MRKLGPGLAVVALTFVVGLPLAATAAAPRPGLAGAQAVRVCGGAGIPYPPSDLAVGFGSAWVGCYPQGTVQRVDLRTGRVQATVRLDGLSVWAVAAGGGSVWAVGRYGGGSVYRIDPRRNRVAGVTSIHGEAFGVWVASGAVWVSDDVGNSVVRLDPRTGKPVATIPTGDGPSDLVGDGKRVWVVNHRDGSIVRIDTATNRATRIVTGLGDERVTAERLALARESLWVTGRLFDLVRLDPETGRVLARIETGPAGIDVVAAGGALWLARATAAAARRGDPGLAALVRVDPAANRVTGTIPVRGSLLLTGMASDGTRVWLADTVAGTLLRRPLRR